MDDRVNIMPSLMSEYFNGYGRQHRENSAFHVHRSEDNNSIEPFVGTGPIKHGNEQLLEKDESSEYRMEREMVE